MNSKRYTVYNPQSPETSDDIARKFRVLVARTPSGRQETVYDLEPWQVEKLRSTGWVVEPVDESTVWRLR
jgi:hypothetical protein